MLYQLSYGPGARQGATQGPGTQEGAAIDWAVARLHIGGKVAAPDWIVVDTQPGPAVDLVASCTALCFADGSMAEIYASHVYEHLGYQEALPRALAEAFRVLIPGGVLRLSVPDLDTLARLFVEPERPLAEKFLLMRMMFGGQMDRFDFHQVGLNWDFARAFLARAGFAAVERVEDHGLFDDASRVEVGGVPISLNLVARKPPA